MSLKAYEDACTRAELFGQPLPDKEEFLAKHKHLDVTEFEEVEIKTAENTAMLDDQLKEGSAGLTELNTILNNTQTKINKLKGVCGSLTNFFRVKLTARDNLSYSSEQSYIGQINYDKDYIPPRTELSSINEGLGRDDEEMIQSPGKSNPNDDKTTSGAMATPRAGMRKQNGGDINSALNDLQAMEKMENSNLASKATVVDISKQVNTQMSKLDQMIHQADRAQTSLNQQNKQMRSLLR